MEKGRDLKILIAESSGYSKEALRILSLLGKVTEMQLTYNQLISLVGDFDVLIVRLKLAIDKTVISKGKRLKYIVSPTTGLDHIDCEEARKRGIQIVSLKGEVDFLMSIPSTAELTWGLILSLSRNIVAAHNNVTDGNWDRDKFRGFNLKGKKLGILGLGRVGMQVANYGRAFDMEIGAFDTNDKIDDDRTLMFKHVEEFMAWCNILTIHIPLTDSNVNYLDRKLLLKLKKGTYMINTSRAAIWDENAVLDLLKNKHLAGVATDVISDEQNVFYNNTSEMVLYAKKNNDLIITPHIGGATWESMNCTEIFVANKLFILVNSGR